MIQPRLPPCATVGSSMSLSVICLWIAQQADGECVERCLDVLAAAATIATISENRVKNRVFRHLAIFYSYDEKVRTRAAAGRGPRGAHTHILASRRYAYAYLPAKGFEYAYFDLAYEHLVGPESSWMSAPLHPSSQHGEIAGSRARSTSSISTTRTTCTPSPRRTGRTAALLAAPPPCGGPPPAARTARGSVRRSAP